jgi:hypothetical protein
LRPKSEIVLEVSETPQVEGPVFGCGVATVAISHRILHPSTSSFASAYAAPVEYRHYAAPGRAFRGEVQKVILVRRGALKRLSGLRGFLADWGESTRR